MISFIASKASVHTLKGEKFKERANIDHWLILKEITPILSRKS